MTPGQPVLTVPRVSNDFGRDAQTTHIFPNKPSVRNVCVCKGGGGGHLMLKNELFSQ